MPHEFDESRFQAESDARTLSEAEIINNDEGRMSAAKIAADRLAKEEREQAAALEKVGTEQSEAVANAKRQFPNTKF